MKAMLERLARLTLLRHRRAQVDPGFDRRLQRCAARETLRPVQAGPFRTRPARPEA